MVGAFLSGAVLDGHWFNRERMDLLRHHVLLVVMPVFFLSTGLRTHWDMGGLAVFVAAGAAQSLWGLCVKVFSNVIVVVLNYVFSKLIIFKKK